MSQPNNQYDCSFLEDILPKAHVAFDDSRREQYSVDASPHIPSMPDAVVWPQSTEETSKLLAAANDRKIPVTPWSGGSGLEGSAIPVDGGIVCNLSDLVSIEIRPEDLEATVGSGVVYDDLNEKTGQYGLRFPPGISSGDVATIGGMVATNASGFNAVRYGETRDHVRNLEVVLSDGRVLQCGRNVVKTSSGYSLKDLFVGSEGTLGVITHTTVALTGIPEQKRDFLVTFPSVEDAAMTVSEIIRYGLKPGALEFMDPLTIELINAYRARYDLPEKPTLLIELHANNGGIDDDREFVRNICRDRGAETWEATNPDTEWDVWQARKDAYSAFQANDLGLDVLLVGDIVVPISKYPALVTSVHQIAEELSVPCPCVGHAGDGNLHYNPLVDPESQSSVENGYELNHRIIQQALAVGGTITGEHGVGVGKRRYMSEEHGEALEVMATLKRTFDPNGILNPGKILPSADE